MALGAGVLLISGFPTNPYPEYVVRALAARNVRVLLITRNAVSLATPGGLCTTHDILPRIRPKHEFLLTAVLETISFLRLLKLLVTVRPPIVHYLSFPTTKLDWLFVLVLKLLRSKLVITVHDTVLCQQSRFDRSQLRSLVRCANAVFVHSRFSKQTIQRHWGVAEHRIRIVPHGLYYRYRPRSLPRRAARATLGFGPSDFVLLLFGTLREYKGARPLILAVREARCLVPRLRLVIAGAAQPPRLAREYARLISSLDLNGMIRLEDRFIDNEEVPQFFSACDLVVLPYTRIDQSGVLFLSYAFRRPVIATRVGGLPEMVRERETGYLVQPDNVTELSEAIIEAWRRRAELPQMEAAIEKLLNERRGWDDLANSLMETYGKLMTRGAPAKSRNVDGT